MSDHGSRSTSENIVKRFGDFTAVNGISFTVKQGEMFGLLGPNGAGKSTLIRMLTTLVPPTSGTRAASTASTSSRKPTACAASIGVIPQAMTSDLELSAGENLIDLRASSTACRARSASG